MDDKLEEARDLLGSLQAILSPVSPNVSGNEGRSIFQSTMTMPPHA